MTIGDHAQGIIDIVLKAAEVRGSPDPLRQLESGQLRLLLSFAKHELLRRESAEEDAQWRAERAAVVQELRAGRCPAPDVGPPAA